MATTLTTGSFGTGLRRIEVRVDKGVEFREFVEEIAEDMGLSDEEFDREIQILIELRTRARKRRGVVCTEPW